MRWKRLSPGLYQSETIWGGPGVPSRYYLIEKKYTADPRQWHLSERDQHDHSRKPYTEWFPTATLDEAKGIAEMWERGPERKTA